MASNFRLGKTGRAAISGGFRAESCESKRPKVPVLSRESRSIPAIGQQNNVRTPTRDGVSKIGPNKSTSLPMKLETLQKLAEKDVIAIDVLTRITSSCEFYAALNVSEKPPADQFRLLFRILAEVSEVNVSLHRHALHSILEGVLNSKLFEWLQADLLELQWKVDPSTMDTTNKENAEQLLCDVMTLVVEMLSSMPGEVKKLMAVVTQIFNTLSSDQFKATVAEGASGDDDDHRSIRRKEQQLRIVWDDLIGKAQEIQKAAEAKSDRIRELEPLDNFRELPVFPREEEIMTLEKPRLRKNVVRGSYESVDHYLDIQFRLLREDFVWPIRDALRDLGLQQAAQGRELKSANTKIIKVYHNVRFNLPEIDRRTGLLVYALQFEGNSFRKMNWQTSRRLMHGSLLCISRDNFETIFFATIFKRDLDELKNGIITVYLDCPPMNEALSYKLDYSFIESPSFFEAYKHVLIALQNIRGPPHQDMPFERHLVFCDPNVPVPKYIEENPSVDICSLSHPGENSRSSATASDVRRKLPSIFHDEFAEEQAGIVKTRNSEYMPPTESQNLLTVSDVRQAQAWPSVSQLALDEWQFEAVRQALTKQITIIQGPPGTGKTYVGLKIARVLLEHTAKTEDDFGPMLLVCYTNHALDQFLEGIAKFMSEENQKKIVRIGGAERMKETMKKFQLKNFLDTNAYRSRYFSALRDSENTRNSLDESIQELSERLKAGLNVILPASEVVTICERAEETLFHATDLPKELDFRNGYGPCNLSRWLCKDHPVDPRRSIVYERLTAMLQMRTKCSLAACRLAACMFGNEFDMAMRWIRQYQQTFGRDIRKKVKSEDEVLFGLELHKNDIKQTEQWLKTNITATSSFHNSQDANKRAKRQNEQKQTKENVNDQQVNMDEAVENQRDFIDEYLDVYHEPGAYQQVGYKSHWTDNGTVPEFVKRQIAKVTPMSDEQAARAVEHAWELPLVERWQLYRNWHRRWMANNRKEIIKLHAQYAKETEKRQEVYDMDMAVKLKKARVIAMTTTGAAKKQALLQQLRPKIVVIEEAAEILEAHIVASLTASCQHLILIGDHKQLRPNPSVHELAKHYRLDVSLFERLINNGFNHVMLREQHRMRPEIADPLMKHFYTDLCNHSSVYNRKDVLGMRKNVFFVDHSHEENDDQDSHSHRNMHEAKFVVALCKYLLFQGHALHKITILTCYLAQMFEIKKLLANTITVPVRVCVVDNFQGEENDIILLSLVRSNSYGKIGFLSVDNRVCVALSRARLGLYVIGNFGQLSRQCELWKNIVTDLEANDIIGNALPIECQIHGTSATVATAEEFQQKAPDGGCMQMCNVRVSCGHVCNRRCHPNDMAHKEVRCVKKCERQCPNGHACLELCYKQCPPCKVETMKKLPCGHEQMAGCGTAVKSVCCSWPCEKELQCGHRCPLKCGEKCSQSACKMLVTKTLFCGHTAEMQCSMGLFTYNCQMLVEKEWPLCQHKNRVTCCTKTELHNCRTKCNAVLQCEHVCRGTCGQCRNGRLHIRCTEPCSRILICGHQCTVNCSATCPPCQLPCENRCVHSSCGVARKDQLHAVNRLCGELCPPCERRCARRCRHHKCDLLCWEPCRRERCLQPCTKLLKCGHSCIGVCGERCPKLCRICQPEKYKQLLSGQFIPIDDTEKETAMFIQLEDCHHIVEMTRLDQWFDSKISERGTAENSVEICLLQCPLCKAPVRTSQRYGSVINQLLLDVERVKIVQHGLPQELKLRRDKLLKIIATIKSHGSNYHAIKPILDMSACLENALRQFPDGQLTRNFVAKMENLVGIAERIPQLWVPPSTVTPGNNNGKPSINLKEFLERFPAHRRYLDEPFMDSLRQLLVDERKYFVRWIIRNGSNASDQMIAELNREWCRIQTLGEVAYFLGHRNAHRANWIVDGSQKLNRILAAIFTTNQFTTPIEQNVKQILDTWRTASRVTARFISRDERAKFLKAMTLSRGHWFKCPKGHVYAIGECGGATQTSVCPECKPTLDEESHSLLTDNAVATKMDGATAWADGKNVDGDRLLAERLQRMGFF